MFSTSLPAWSLFTLPFAVLFVVIIHTTIWCFTIFVIQALHPFTICLIVTALQQLTPLAIYYLANMQNFYFDQFTTSDILPFLHVILLPFDHLTIFLLMFSPYWTISYFTHCYSDSIRLFPSLIWSFSYLVILSFKRFLIWLFCKMFLDFSNFISCPQFTTLP